MKGKVVRVAEVLLLFGALAFCVPSIPSHDMERLPLLPGAAFAVLFFAGSRALRWRPQWWLAIVETLLFAGFAFVLNAAINIIYSNH